jgi:TetR/AcrR family transcriptional repressor of nem operon
MPAKKYNKEDILERGVDLLRRNGYNGTGINKVLDEAGIPRGSFYHFFKSKEDFVLSSIEHHAKCTKGFGDKWLLDEDKPPFERLIAFYRARIKALEKENYRFGCVLHNLTQEIGGSNAKIRRRLLKCINLWISEVAECIAAGQSTGEIRSDIDAKELAAYLHSSYNGSVMRAKLEKNNDSLELFMKITLGAIKP